MTPSGVLQDTHNRTVRDLRVSITDRCNFRCAYCLPETEEAANFFRSNRATGNATKQETKLGYPWKPKSQILTLEEITRVIRIASSLGVNKVRITGGEPLLRRNVETLVDDIAALGTISDLSLTSNGTHFPRLAKRLKEAGLSRITLSLDSLDRDNFRKITGRDGLDDVLESIRLAKSLGLTPVKVNAVIIRDLNDHEIEDLAKFAIQEQIVMRMIEFMPLDSGRAWQRDHVVPGEEIIQRINACFPLTALPSQHPAETANRWSLGEGDAEIGSDCGRDVDPVGGGGDVRVALAGGADRVAVAAHGQRKQDRSCRKDEESGGSHVSSPVSASSYPGFQSALSR